MGLPSVRRKRADIGQMQLATGPIPGTAIPRRLVNPVGFDKADHFGVLRVFEDIDGLRRPIRDLRDDGPDF
jgi:hypothetical protein